MIFEAQTQNISNANQIEFNWDFGDGKTGQGATIEHTYSWPGKYAVSLRAQFPDDSLIVAEHEISLGTDPAPPDSADNPDDEPTVPPPDEPVDDGTDLPPDDGVSGEVPVDEPPSDEPPAVEPPPDDSPEPVEPTDPSNINLEAIARLEAGLTDTADASWWGFDPADSTDAIQSALNSGAKIVLIPNMGSDWIVRPLFLASNQEVVFADGVVLTAKSGAFRGTHDCLFTGDRVSNVKLRGTNAVLRMRKADYTTSHYSVSEFRHVLSLQGVSNVQVTGLSLQSSGGDGLYIGPGEDRAHAPSRNMLIQNCDMYNNHRQGISVLSAENLTIDHCTIRGTIGTAPQAAMDLEPDDPGDMLVNVNITNCTCTGNAGSGFMANLTYMTPTSRPISVTVSNLHVQGSRQTAMRVIVAEGGPPGGFLTFRNCLAEGTEYSGLSVKWNMNAFFDVTFDHCEWRNNARFLEDAPVLLQFFGAATANATGGISFLDCLVNDQKVRDPIVAIDDQVTSGAPDVTGTIFVTNSAIDSAITDPNWPLPDLRVQMLPPP